MAHSNHTSVAHPDSHNMFNTLSRLSTSTLTIGGLTLIALISMLDFLSGTELSFSIFYILPIIIVSWYVGLRAGLLFSFICAGAWASAEVLGGNEYSSSFVLSFNTFVRLSIFLIITGLIHKLRQNAELLTENQLLAQRSYDVITTSQRLALLIAKNVIEHNSRLWLWIVQQKSKGVAVPKIVESTSLKIGANLSSLTEICYSYQPSGKENVDLEQLIDQVETGLTHSNTLALLQETETTSPTTPDSESKELEVPDTQTQLLIKLTNEKLAL